MLTTISWQLGSRMVQSELTDDDLWVRVEVEHWQDAARIARDELRCEYFVFLSAIDWLVNPHLDGEKAFVAGDKEDAHEIIADGPDGTPPERKAGGTSRFQLIGRLFSVEEGIGVTFTADLADEPEAPSWVPIYKGADWHEREAWEMYGVNFVGHPGLRHIYLPAEFEGFPQRKDFPLLARQVRPWPGLVDLEEMPAPETKADAETGADE
jgi:NADH-quinone oxidoreductase subunit C